MSQRKKSKTKKQMKKSINGLYNSLQKEKSKHFKASKMIGYQKRYIQNLEQSVNAFQTELRHAKSVIGQLRYDEQHASEVMANLLRKM